jgi:hypothetical protein
MPLTLNSSAQLSYSSHVLVRTITDAEVIASVLRNVQDGFTLTTARGDQIEVSAGDKGDLIAGG